MPKYFCNQCGAPVETGDSFAPPDPTCPACRGEVPPPGHEPEALLEQAPPPPLVHAPAPPLPPALPLRPVVAYPYLSPGQDPQRPAKAKSYAGWVLISTLIAGAITVVGVSFNSPGLAERGTGYMIGSGIGATAAMAAVGLVVGLLVALIALAFKKPFRSSLARAYCLAVILISVISLLGNLMIKTTTARRQAAQVRAEKQKQTVDGMEQDIERMMAESRNPDGTIKETDFRLESKTPTNEMESVRHLMQSILNDSADMQSRYAAALKEDGLFTLLEAQRLAEDEGLKESRVILARCGKQVAKYREEAKQLVLGLPQRLDSYPQLTAAQKRSYLSNYKEQSNQQLSVLNANWDFEEEILGHMEDIIDLLESKRADWSLDEGALLFQKDEDLERYNGLLKKIDETAAQQTELQKKTQDSMKAQINNLKETIEK